MQLLGEELEELRKRLDDRGLELALDESGATIPSMQIGLYAPGGADEGVGLGSD